MKGDLLLCRIMIDGLDLLAICLMEESSSASDGVYIDVQPSWERAYACLFT
jgi:hypothetical protein